MLPYSALLSETFEGKGLRNDIQLGSTYISVECYNSFFIFPLSLILLFLRVCIDGDTFHIFCELFEIGL